jgi:hypothetical protein
MATVRHWVPPNATPASRKSFGMRLSTSSEVLAIVGIIKIVKANAPIKPEKDFVIGYKIAERINNPATIDGTPLIA